MRLLRVIVAVAMIGSVLFVAPGARAAAPGISLAGNQFLWAGQPFVPHGFNSTALLNSQWCTTNTTQKAAANFTPSELSTAKNTWHANTLRFQVSQPVLAGANGAAYAQQIQTSVAQARAAGFVVDVSMQDQSLACGPAQPLPSAETETAWTTLINNSALASDPGIMFEVFNEPQNQPTTTPSTDPQTFTWVDWQNGGRQIQPSTGDNWTAYTPVGHQDLVNLLRNTLHVTNVLIADGSRLGEHLEGLPLLTDPGSSYQIAYGIHPYFYTDGQTNWDKRFGYLAGSQALIATEWNYTSDKCGTTAETMAPGFLAYMRDTVHIGILGHALDVFNGQLMADTALDPTKCGTTTPGGGTDFLNYMTSLPGDALGVSITAPGSGQTVSQVVPITAAATPTPGSTIQSVSYQVSGPVTSSLGTATASPYTYNWDTTSLPNGNYTLTATATQSNGTTAQSSIAVVVSNGLAAPSGLASSGQTTTSVSLGWSPPGGTADDPSTLVYTVYRDGLNIGTTGAGVTSFTDTGLQPNTSYSYTVAATDSTGVMSAQTPALNVSTAACPPPPAPAGFTAANSPSGVLLNWSAVTPATGCVIDHYTITRDDGPIGATTGTAFTDSTFGDALSYTYTVSAVTADGITGSSSSAQVNMPDTTAPSVPSGLTASIAGGHEIDLTWQPSTDNLAVAGYHLYRNGSLLASVTSGTSYADTGLTDATTYSYAVGAYDAAGNVSGQTSQLTVATPDVTSPTVPANLKLASTSQGVTVNWTASSDNVGVAGYYIYRGTIKIGTTTGISYTDKNVVQGGSYTYRVAAYDAAGNVSAKSAGATTTFDITPPTAPSNLKAVSGSKSIALSWTASKDNVGVAGYYVYRGGTKIASVSGTATSYTNTGLITGTTYSYYVIAYDSAGNKSAASNTVSAKAK